MRVNLAAQVLCASVASVLKSFGPPEAAGTAKLCKMVDNFFDYLNVRNRLEHERKRKPFLAPYTLMHDERYNHSGVELQCFSHWQVFAGSVKYCSLAKWLRQLILRGATYSNFDEYQLAEIC